MNKVELIGRFTAEPDVTYTNGGLTIMKATLAVDRKNKAEGQQTADFIRITAFGKTAEFIEKYFSKGMKIAICGRIQTGSYTNNDNKKVYTTDVIVEECEFVEKKDAGDAQARANASKSNDGFMDVTDDLAEELPFV